MNTLHLFAGAGGGLLCDLILGHTPIGAVELDPYCCSVLRERSAEGWFPNLRVHEGDIRLFDPSEYEGRVDCIHAGFPCQPHSVAGKREGEADKRNLWPETARIIGQLRPRFALLENVPGIVSNGYAAVVVGELSQMGYDARWAIISAADAGAPHLRERWWLLATNANGGYGGTEQKRKYKRAEEPSGSGAREMEPSLANPDRLPRHERWPGNAAQEPRRRDADRSGECADMANPTSQRQQGPRESVKRGRKETYSKGETNNVEPMRFRGFWEVEPDVGRVVDGLAARVDRLKALGNGQVSLTAALAWKLLGGP